ncbi:MAG TPA: hypothetical protein DCQ32_02880 [Cyanobacteria bacterium UBA8156]|jgi:hypothetical protein|nr:hypothetical protein [Cyanobacteria bacterium UBA8156]
MTEPVSTPENRPVPEPNLAPQAADPTFGFNGYAERLNGRAAMIGFILVLAIEVLTGQGLLGWVGLIDVT